MTIGSLFAGIGGLELGLEAAGLGPVRWQVEIDPFATQILARHWPDAVRHDDVRTVGAHNLTSVDIICGGFPCQDISTAGKGAGIDGARSGLWAEYARIIGELRPRLVVVENVAALAGRGLGRVLGDLSERGYDAIWLPLRASDVGAPHRRERLFIVGWRVADGDGSGARRTDARRQAGAGSRIGDAGALADPLGSESERRRGSGDVGSAAGDARGEGDQRQRGGDAARDRGQAVADAERPRRHKRPGARGERGRGAQPAHGGAHTHDMAGAEVTRREAREPVAGGVAASEPGAWGVCPRPPLSRLGRGPDGLPAGTHLPARWPARPGEPQAPWEPPRTVEQEPHRARRLKALGNAVVPQVAYVVGCVAREILEVIP